MATEVLRPQDCLVERIRVDRHVFPRRKGSYGGNAKPNRRVDQKKRVNQNGGSDGIKAAKRSDNLVMGRVTILRRGEFPGTKEMIASGTERIGPDPEMVPKQIGLMDPRSSFSPTQPKKAVWADTYAGSAFAMSPAPSSLPLPSFYKKKQAEAEDDSASRDLRRLLRLD